MSNKNKHTYPAMVFEHLGDERGPKGHGHGSPSKPVTIWRLVPPHMWQLPASIRVNQVQADIVPGQEPGAERDSGGVLK